MVYSGTNSDAGVAACSRPRSPNAAGANRVAEALGGVAARPAEPRWLGRFVFGPAVTRERHCDGRSPNPPPDRAGRGHRWAGAAGGVWAAAGAGAARQATPDRHTRAEPRAHAGSARSSPRRLT